MDDTLGREGLARPKWGVRQDEDGLPGRFQHIRRPQGRDPASEDDGVVVCLSRLAHGISKPKNSTGFRKQMRRTMSPTSSMSRGISPFSMSVPIILQRMRRKYS